MLALQSCFQSRLPGSEAWALEAKCRDWLSECPRIKGATQQLPREACQLHSAQTGSVPEAGNQTPTRQCGVPVHRALPNGQAARLLLTVPSKSLKPQQPL